MPETIYCRSPLKGSTGRRHPWPSSRSLPYVSFRSAQSALACKIWNVVAHTKQAKSPQAEGLQYAGIPSWPGLHARTSCNEALQMGHPPPRYAWRLGSAELKGTNSAQHCIGQHKAMIENLHLQSDLTPLDKAFCSPSLKSSPVAMPCVTSSLPPRSDVSTTCKLSSESLSIPLLWSISLSTFSTVAVRAEPAHSCASITMVDLLCFRVHYGVGIFNSKYILAYFLTKW